MCKENTKLYIVIIWYYRVNYIKIIIYTKYIKKNLLISSTEKYGDLWVLIYRYMHARTDANKHKVNISHYAHITDEQIAKYQKYSTISCHQTIKNYKIQSYSHPSPIHNTLPVSRRSE